MTIKEYSAGGIVFQKQGKNTLFLLIRPKEKGYWTFPKGLIDPGEHVEETAVREVQEETGVSAKIVKKLGINQYFYTYEGQKFFKTVTLFLMEYHAQKGDPDGEVDETKWVEEEEMKSILRFEGDKKMFESAKEIVALL